MTGLSPGARTPALDSLRGAAILGVFAYHAFFWSGMRGDTWLSRGIAFLTRPGWLGVDLFFVLSGFLITGRLLGGRQLPARVYYWSFYRRRALRIIPLYYAVLAIIGPIMWWASETTGGFLAASVVFFPNLALILGLWANSPLAVLWSLGVEAHVYLLWPLLVRTFTTGRLVFLFAAVAVVEPVLRYLTFFTGLREGISYASWLRLDGFACGGLLAIVVSQVRVSKPQLAALGAGALLSSTVVLAVCAWGGHLSRRTAAGNAVQFADAAVFFTGLLAMALARNAGPGVDDP
jgi:peptidoglycan/LPS O-acetylase OafA/YrhL